MLLWRCSVSSWIPAAFTVSVAWTERVWCSGAGKAVYSAGSPADVPKQVSGTVITQDRKVGTMAVRPRLCRHFGWYGQPCEPEIFRRRTAAPSGCAPKWSVVSRRCCPPRGSTWIWFIAAGSAQDAPRGRFGLDDPQNSSVDEGYCWGWVSGRWAVAALVPTFGDGEGRRCSIRP